jgi:hypothetical protein
VWFQDEMRVGQKSKLTYLAGPVGSRPRAAHDQRRNSEAMQLHLNEIATKVAPGAHAILILDQAGWHGAKQLRIPARCNACMMRSARE